VLEYLRQKFDWAQERDSGAAGIGIDAGEGRDRWHITVSEDFLDEHDPGTVRKLLEDWNLAGEMRRSEGLHLTVSPAGIRLESSN
jgi:hypothetical protein